MLRSKRLISMGLTVLMVSAYSSGAYTGSVNALEMTKQAKMSEILLAEMDKASKNEKIPVAIELEDINQNEVEKAVDKQTGISMEALEVLESNLLDSEELKNASNEELDSMLPGYFADTKEDREYIQGLVNERISEKRKISKQMYTEKNAERIEKLGIDENDLDFVSSYSPMIIGEMTESEVEDIVINSNVKSIDYDADVEISVEDTDTMTMANTASSAKAAAAPSAQDLYVNIWKSAVNVDYTINTLGLKGEGLNVGLFDTSSVTKNHDELKNTNITNLDEEYYYRDDHGEFCTRILAGSNGVVSKANIYTSNYAKDTDTQNVRKEKIHKAIENLISHNVTVISFSVAFNLYQVEYYGQIEKWLDYICNSSGVVMVFAAGNVFGNDYNIFQGAAAYNVITVGGIDTKGTIDKSDDVFWTDTSTANNGNNACAKPDVEAPSTNVFKKGGTSASAPIVAGICAQIIEAKPTLAFYPQEVKAILMASCDRKGKGGESYTAGITAKEGSGVVNAKLAIEIVTTNRHLHGTWKNGSIDKGVFYLKDRSPDYTKIACTWLVPAASASNTEIPNFVLVVSSNDGKAERTTNLPNSSAEMIVDNNMKYIAHLSLLRYDSGTSEVPYAVAWY